MPKEIIKFQLEICLTKTKFLRIEPDEMMVSFDVCSLLNVPTDIAFKNLEAHLNKCDS